MMSNFWEYASDVPAQRALMACALFGFANGFMSGFVVMRKSALKMGTLSHGLLPGIALAVLFMGLTQWTALAGAIVAALFIGLGSLFLSRTSRLDQDTSMAILYTSAFAGGYILLTSLNMTQKLSDWLFGSITGMSDADLWIAFGIAATAVLTLTVLQRPLLIYLFEPNVAASLGVPVRALNYTLFGVMILMLLSSLQAVGCILSLGLMVTPGATVYLCSDNTRTIFLSGGILGAVGAISAFFLSYVLSWNIGSTIVLVLGAMFCIAYVFSPKYGLFAKHRQVVH
jgi:ABC-type Mn2+/Zn2+ transport system permease subunit